MKPSLVTMAVGLIVSLQAFASSIDGVPMNCLEKAENRMTKNKKMGLVSVCRYRQDPSKEYYTYCDGSRCTGFTATFTNNTCSLTDWWNGQDDQDQIDPIEWKESCLTSADF